MIDLVNKATAESESKQHKDIHVNKINRARGKKLSEVDKNILRTIKNNVDCTNRHISDALCLYGNYVCVYMTRLRLAGLIERTRVPYTSNSQYTYKLSNKVVAML